MADSVKALYTTAGYLYRLETERIPCTIFLMNGFQMHNVTLIGHDNTSILLEVGGKQQAVFRQTISTIEPYRPVRLDAKNMETFQKRYRSYETGDGHTLLVEADVRTDETGQHVIENLTQSDPLKNGGGPDDD